MLVFPELWIEVYVAGPSWEERAFAEMFARARCSRANSPEEADLVVFPGGEDVDPALYGELKHPSTKVDPEQDKHDLLMYGRCYEQGIPMLGICRGAQFGHVMNGGKLYQHVDGHYGDHSMFDVREHVDIPRISSVHHQMIIPEEDSGIEIIAVSNGVSNKRYVNHQDYEEGDNEDVEAFFYRDSCFLGIQGHPEYNGYHKFAKWTMEQIMHYIVNNPDIHSVKNHLRLKKEILEQRLATKTWKELS